VQVSSLQATKHMVLVRSGSDPTRSKSRAPLRRRAALAPIPLWLSSLGLLVPNLLFTVTLAAFALALSCRAVYHGIVELGGAREPVTAVWITQIAVGGALIPWVLLVAVLMTA
jgi:hypothetical protein